MSKEHMQRHIEEARTIEKKNIFGMYLLSFIMFMFWGMIAVVEYRHIPFTVLYFLSLLIAFVYSIYHLKAHDYNLESKVLTFGISCFFMWASFQLLAMYGIQIGAISTSITISTLLLGELFIVLAMGILLFRNIRKGIQPWQMVLTSILGGATPLTIVLLSQTIAFDTIGNDIAATILMYVIGILLYPVMDNGVKILYFMKQRRDNT